MNINEGLTGLSEAIKSTPEFSRLKQEKTVLSKNPGLKKELEDFNSSQKQLFSGKVPENETEARLKQLNTKLESLSKVPEVKRYLDSLNSFNQMMMKVYSQINELLEKNL